MSEWLRYGRRVIVHSPLELLRVPQRALHARRSRRGTAGFVLSPFANAAAAPHALPLRLPADARAPLSIPLASRNWSLAQGAPWTHSFDDPEDALASHRMSWSIPLLASHGGGAVPVLRRLFDEWMAAHGEPGDRPGWDSYSTAERIAAAVYLIAAGGDDHDGTLRAAVRQHASYLAGHLEFRGSSTNNHLLNDARALYLAGMVDGDARLMHTSRELFDFSVPRMFVDGMLREGSTHYHLLLLRTLTEVALAARLAGDRAFGERAQSWATDAASAAAVFVHEGDAMPLIGDLSPDFTPRFLAGLGGADDSAAGWSSLLGITRNRSSRAPEGADSRPGAGYYRAASGGFETFAFVNPDGHVPAWSHAHADMGSFTVSWHDRPLLVDAGRATYKPGGMSDFGRSARSHNTHRVDGCEPCVVHGLNGYPEMFRSDYIDARPRASAHAGVGEARLDIAHEGFARLGSSLHVSRAIVMTRESLHLTDAISGSGRHTIETFFHLAPEAAVERVEAGKWRVSLPGAPNLLFAAGADAALHRGTPEPQPMGWTSRRYGSAVPSTSLVFTSRAALPHTATYSLTRA